MTVALTIVNRKEGVGKTTDSVNSAGTLAERNNRVLVIDADPQGYLTSSVGLNEEYSAEKTNLNDAIRVPQEHTLSNLVIVHEAFDVNPANIDIFTLEQDLVSAMRSRKRFSMLWKRPTTGMTLGEVFRAEADY